jgi:CMP-N,N'-diacetyllegionaminic acid synthase
MRTLGLIPARGGSKSIPRKNIRLLCGKPLLQYTAEAVLKARRLGRVILSTEDEEIARIGRECGLDVPFIRPVELARDTTPMLPVVQHAVQYLEMAGERFDAICILQPTVPLRPPGVIDACIEMFEKNGADTVITILPVPHQYNPHWVYFEAGDGSLHLSTGEDTPTRRQDLPPAFSREGSVYVVRRDVIMELGSLYGKRMLGFLIDPERSVNIDSPEDWSRAESLLSKDDKTA